MAKDIQVYKFYKFKFYKFKFYKFKFYKFKFTSLQVQVERWMGMGWKSWKSWKSWTGVRNKSRT
jgi:hypothetical protein